MPKKSFMSKLPYIIIYGGVVLALVGVSFFFYQSYREHQREQAEAARIAEIKARKIAERKAAERLQAEINRRKAVEKKKQQAFEKAMKYARENKAKPRLVKPYLIKMRNYLKGSRYESPLEEKIASIRITDRPDDYSDDPEVVKLMEKLHRQARPFVQGKRFMEAMKVYRDYKGKLGKRSEAARGKFAEKYYKLNCNYARIIDIAEKKLRKILRESGKDIIRFHIETAISRLRKAKEDPDIEPIKPDVDAAINILARLNDLDEAIYNSFSKDRGKVLTIDTVKGKVRGKVLEVKNHKIYIKIKIGKAYFRKIYKAETLSLNEQLKRLASVNDVEKYLYIGLNAFKAKKIEKAKECFKKTGLFADAMIEALGEWEVRKMRKSLG